MVLDHFQTFVFILVHLGSLEVVFNAICGLDGWGGMVIIGLNSSKSTSVLISIFMKKQTLRILFSKYYFEENFE